MDKARAQPLAQACIESGYFCTVGISFLEKKFWKIKYQFLKKLPSLPVLIQRQNRQGFLRYHGPERLILQVLFYAGSGKRLTERRYSFISSIKKGIAKNRREFSVTRSVSSYMHILSLPIIRHHHHFPIRPHPWYLFLLTTSVTW